MALTYSALNCLQLRLYSSLKSTVIFLRIADVWFGHKPFFELGEMPSSFILSSSLIHPCGWIDDEENVRTPPKLGR